jgi:hypothetical protein
MGLKRPTPVQLKRAGVGEVPLQRNGGTSTTATTATTATTSSTATSGTATSTPLDAPSADPARIGDIQNVIKGSTGGDQALKIFTDHSAKIEFGASGSGCAFHAGDNKVTLDPSWPNGDLALALVHESNHVDYWHKNLTANAPGQITTLPKADYVNKMIDEETESTTRQIETKMEIEAASGGTMAGANEQAGEKTYRKAYKKKYDAEIAASKSESDAKAAARIEGKAEVKKDYENGNTILTSTSPQVSYKVYYEAAWDKANGVTSTPAPQP